MEPAAPMFHLLIFGNVSIKNPKIHEIQKSVNSKNPWNPEIRETFKSRCHKFPGSKYSQEVTFSGQLFPRKSTFPEGVNFSRGSQLFPRESTFPEGVNFSRGSQLFPRESTFPKVVNISRGSQIYQEVTFPGKSHTPAWATEPLRMKWRRTDDGRHSKMLS